MDDDQLSPEEQRLKQQFADEDSGKIPTDRIEYPPLVPVPTAEDEVVAEIRPRRPRGN